jgi:hypothetical protein
VNAVDNWFIDGIKKLKLALEKSPNNPLALVRRLLDVFFLKKVFRFCLADGDTAFRSVCVDLSGRPARWHPGRQALRQSLRQAQVLTTYLQPDFTPSLARSYSACACCSPAPWRIQASHRLQRRKRDTSGSVAHLG